jgi:hypothetical protein
VQDTWDLGSEISHSALMTAQKETEITLLPSLACSSVSLLTVESGLMLLLVTLHWSV